MPRIPGALWIVLTSEMASAHLSLTMPSDKPMPNLQHKGYTFRINFGTIV
jgi:hypothetical protein